MLSFSGSTLASKARIALSVSNLDLQHDDLLPGVNPYRVSQDTL